MAQGKAGAANNWWFGGRNCRKFENSRIWGNIVKCSTDTGGELFFVRGKAWTKCEAHNKKLPTHTKWSSIRVFDSEDSMYSKMNIGSKVFCIVKTAYDVGMAMI